LSLRKCFLPVDKEEITSVIAGRLAHTTGLIHNRGAGRF
jgi:hypothetical protein